MRYAQLLSVAVVVAPRALTLALVLAVVDLVGEIEFKLLLALPTRL
jgi:hypothetical protein